MTAPDPPAAARQAATIRKATGADLPRIARALARAFYDDPPTIWASPDDGRRMQRLERIYAHLMRRVLMRQDESYTTGDVVGAALWVRPGESQLGVLRQLALLPGTASALGTNTPRMLRVAGHVYSRQPHDRPHCYLAFLGVEPEWQGKGLGTALMRPVLERCDELGTPAYLEASTPRSRSCYQRVGFEVMEEFEIPPKGGPPVWQMWREPRRAGGGGTGSATGG